MMTRRWLAALCALMVFSSANADILEQQMDKAEADEVRQRLQNFYQKKDDPKQMQQAAPKYDPAKKQFVKPNQILQLQQGQQQDVQQVSGEAKQLLQQAQQKATQKFQQHQCKTFIDKKFPQLGCKDADGKASAEANDKVEDLADGWIPDDGIVRAMDELKTQGRTKFKLWSDDYWKIRYGITSYRYATRPEFVNFKAAVESYAQPKDWLAVMGLGAAALTAKVNQWSPSEKYDLTVGDDKFTLTNEQKQEGWGVAEKDDVENWMGICHGWAPAAFMVPKADKEVSVVGAKGVKLTWYPHDIRAMASLAWSNGESDTNFIGGRCDVKKVTTLKNGRISQQECFDNNPATFHLALANMIGEIGASFVMDKTFDYEVWNQPIQSYDFTYFNPLDRSKQSKKWEEVAVAYDKKFKDADRFQNPKTRGVRKGRTYDDKGIKKIVGVAATVSYLEEVEPTHGKTASSNSVARVTYTYDLELHAKGGDLVPVGGEWHSNVHPDFLWVPTKKSIASLNYDEVALGFTGKKEPAKKVTQTAKSASAAGYPLCQVLSHLVEKSSGEKYSCE